MIVIAGPCVVENYGTLLEIAHIVKDAGAQYLRGGAYKPRTSCHSFQGLEEKGLKYLLAAANEVGLKLVTEVMNVNDVGTVFNYADMIQVGSRNMMNYSLLKKLSDFSIPILLKRGFMATIDEWINASKYLGDNKIIFCERGIRTFDSTFRFNFDINAIAYMKQQGYTVIADPSHGTGIRELVAPVSMAALAAGADGLMVEVHTNPEEALSDGQQSLYPSQFKKLMEMIK
jgi:3-deoxy-7-phosphoheptulonate synthase